MKIDLKEMPLKKLSDKLESDFIIPIKEKLDKNRPNYKDLTEGQRNQFDRLGKELEFFQELNEKILDMLLLHSITIGAISSFVSVEGEIVFPQGNDFEANDISMYQLNTVFKDKFVALKKHVELNISETKFGNLILLQKKFILEAINILDVKQLNIETNE